MTALGVEGISASSVSRITKELDEKVCEFFSKPIEHEIPYLFIDATYLKLRMDFIMKTKLSLSFPKSEMMVCVRFLEQDWQTARTLFWQDMFDDLKERGIRSVKLIVSDGHCQGR